MGSRPRRSVLGVAVIGAGYWGPNLVRNFDASQRWELRWLCDLDVARAERVVGRRGGVRITDASADVLADSAVDAVAIATPTFTHASLAAAALQAGKHVLLEKPLASSLNEGRALVEHAEREGLVLMCDHTFCYTPAVRTIRELVRRGRLGRIQYVDSVRINLGLVQPDIDVIWDLAPHDVSILDFILPEECRPLAVSAQGADPLGTGCCSVAYLSLPLDYGGIAHVHVNWLSPTKIRKTIIGGSRRMVVWDDTNPSQRLSVYDKGVELQSGQSHEEARMQKLVSYRIGDMVAPALPEQEALQSVVTEFAAAIEEGRQPLTDGSSGLRVLGILEAASLSLRRGGARVALDEGAAEPELVAVAR